MLPSRTLARFAVGSTGCSLYPSKLALVSATHIESIIPDLCILSLFDILPEEAAAPDHEKYRNIN